MCQQSFDELIILITCLVLYKNSVKTRLEGGGKKEFSKNILNVSHKNILDCTIQPNELELASLQRTVSYVM